MAKLRREHVMIAREMIARDVSIREVADKLGVDESTLRYRLDRPLDAKDGRRDRKTALDGWDTVVTAVLERFGDGRVVEGAKTRCPTRVVFDVLTRDREREVQLRLVPEPLEDGAEAAPFEQWSFVVTPEDGT